MIEKRVGMRVGWLAGALAVGASASLCGAPANAASGRCLGGILHLELVELEALDGWPVPDMEVEFWSRIRSFGWGSGQLVCDEDIGCNLGWEALEP